jgi:hypothetical protein
LPSEGKGHTFESCRVRHFTILSDFAAEACRRRSNAALRRRSYAADLLLRDRGGAGSSVDVKMREPQPPRLATSAP